MGSQEALAERIGTRQQTVSWWLNESGKVPAEFVLKVEAATNREVTRHQLRPDIYPAEANQ